MSGSRRCGRHGEASPERGPAPAPAARTSRSRNPALQKRPTEPGAGMARTAAALTLTIAGALGALSALSACGPSDGEMRNEVRAGMLGSCLEAAQGKAAPAGFDGQAFCSCVTDRLTEGRSGRELTEQAP